jgi:hypothetical protein
MEEYFGVAPSLSDDMTIRKAERSTLSVKPAREIQPMNFRAAQQTKDSIVNRKFVLVDKNKHQQYEGGVS